MSVLSVRNARKNFASTAALQDASMELREGELLALLGPNGAGKTTLIRAIAGRVRLDAGEIELLGRRFGPSELRPDLGVVPQEIALYPTLTARENLEAFGTFYGVSRGDLAARVQWALDWTGLVERAREPVNHFSGGMKRRLNLACAVLHHPKVLLLDEPTVGVDPQSREKIYEMLDRLRATGNSMLLTTHHLEEAEARCERIVIIDHGRIVAEGTLAELVRKTIGDQRVVTLKLDRAPESPIDGFESLNGGTELRARVNDLALELPDLFRRVHSTGRTIQNVDVRGPSLQSVFIHLTGKELRE